MRNRVVVTGLGIVSAAGNGSTDFCKSVINGDRFFSKISNSELQHLGENYAALINDYPVSKLLSEDEQKKLDPINLLAFVALEEALTDAKLSGASFDNKTALVFATCSGPMLSIERSYKNGTRNRDKKELSYDYTTTVILKKLKLSGFSTTVTTACSSGTGAVSIASDLIREGRADRVIVVGADTFAPTTLVGFLGLKAIAENGCTPFSTKTGMSLGEAGASLILEKLEIAENRESKIICEIAGSGMSNDAFHSSAPDRSGRGQAMAMNRAIKNSGSVEIGFVNAHATGTAANDIAESKALRRVFGEKIDDIPVTSTKSMVGHTLGAAGLVEIIATVIMSKKDEYPVTAGFEELRSGVKLNVVTESGRTWSDLRPFMNNNFAFGGNNASVIISKDSTLVNDFPENIENLERIFITGIGKISADETGFVPKIDSRKIDRRLDISGMDRASSFATIATKLAIKDAKISERPSELKELGIILGLNTGATAAEKEHIEPLISNGFSIDHINSFPLVVPNSVQGSVCRSLGLMGHNTVITSGLSASHESLYLGFSALRTGHLSKILTGAVNENLPQFENSGSVEGASVFMLETDSSVQKRNITSIAEIVSLTFFNFIDGDINSSIKSEIDNILLYNKILVKNIAVLVISVPQKQNKYLSKFAQENEISLFDVYESFGDLKSVASLMGISNLILSNLFENNKNKKYILSLSFSDDGRGSIIILKLTN